MGSTEYPDSARGVPHPESIGTPPAPRPDAEAVASAGSGGDIEGPRTFAEALAMLTVVRPLAQLGARVVEILKRPGYHDGAGATDLRRAFLRIEFAACSLGLLAGEEAPRG